MSYNCGYEDGRFVSGAGALVVATITSWVLWERPATANTCTNPDDWPFKTVSCELYESTGSRLASASSAPDPKLTAEDIKAVALEYHGPAAAAVLEAQLVEIPGGSASDGELITVWAVAMEMTEGPTPPSWSAIHGAQLGRVKSAAGTTGQPPTISESEVATVNAEQYMSAWRRSIVAAFHIAYFDPDTGEWLGAVETSELDETKFESLLPVELR